MERMAPSWMVFPWYEFDELVPVPAVPPQAANTSANTNATPRATLLISLPVLFPLRLCGQLSAQPCQQATDVTDGLSVRPPLWAAPTAAARGPSRSTTGKA